MMSSSGHAANELDIGPLRRYRFESNELAARAVSQLSQELFNHRSPAAEAPFAAAFAQEKAAQV